MVVCSPLDDRFQADAGKCLVYLDTEIPGSTVRQWQLDPTIEALNDFTGRQANDRFGTSVAGQSFQGTKIFLVGAPGTGPGRSFVRLIQFYPTGPDAPPDAPIWKTRMSLDGPTSTSQCGMSTAAARETVAFGCPGFGSNNNGRVYVVDLDGNRFGNPIDGADNEQLGQTGTIDISGNCASTIFPCFLTVSTATSLVKKYWFASWIGGDWELVEAPLTVENPVKVATSPNVEDNLRTVISGQLSNPNVCTVLDVTNIEFPAAPTASPTVSAAPSITPTTSPVPSASPTMSAEPSTQPSGTVAAHSVRSQKTVVVAVLCGLVAAVL